jgi:hypothetical protein
VADLIWFLLALGLAYASILRTWLTLLLLLLLVVASDFNWHD